MNLGVVDEEVGVGANPMSYAAVREAVLMKRILS